MDTETVGNTTLAKLSEEDNLVLHLLNRDVVVLHPRIDLLKLVELVVVGGKQGLCLLPVLVDVLHNGPSN